MSGKKCTPYTPSAERRRLEDALRAHDRESSRLNAVSLALQALAQESTTPGFSEEFGEVLATAAAWDEDHQPTASPARNAGALQASASAIGRKAKAGEAILDELRKARARAEDAAAAAREDLGAESLLDLARQNGAEGRQVAEAAAGFRRADAELAAGRALAAAAAARGARTIADDLIDHTLSANAEGVAHHVADQTARLRAGLARTTPGLRQAYPEAVAAAETWLAEAPPTPTGDDIEARRRALKAGLERVAAGDRALKDLREAIVVRAGRERAALAAARADLAARLEADRETIRRWTDQGPIDAGLQRVADLTARDEFAEAREAIQSAAAALASAGAVAEENEALHRRRLEVVRGLRSVCSDMGMDVPQEPAYELPGDLRSRLSFVAVTAAGEEIRFWISLDQIEADSCIVENSCLDRFADFSRNLERNYGVVTGFRIVEPLEPRDQAAQEGGFDRGAAREGSA